MQKVYVKYNPYSRKTDVKINGVTPEKNSKLNFGDRRLQEWIDTLPGIIYEQLGTKRFRLVFCGTDSDCEDMEATVEEARCKGYNIDLECQVSRRCEGKEDRLRKIFAEIQNGPYKTQKEFQSLYDPEVEKAFEEALNGELEVNVMATMSSGKSTLINSLLGKKLMPAKQEACTAIITRIKDNDRPVFTAKSFNKAGRIIKSVPSLTLGDMERLNGDPNVAEVHLEGNIPFVTADEIALVLVDTPGPDNGRNKEHYETAMRALHQSSKTLIVYVMTPRFGTNDDNTLLKTIAKEISKGGKQARDRFLFVVNQLDNFKKGEDSVEKCLAEVRKYLAQEGIENANIYPASALTALNIRTLLSVKEDDLDEDDDEVASALLAVRKFNKREDLHLEQIASLPALGKRKVEQRLDEAKRSCDVHEQALIHSGIVSLEEAIRLYVEKYARPDKIKKAVDVFMAKVTSAKAMEEIKSHIASSEEQKREILGQIHAIREKLESQDDVEEFKYKIDSRVKRFVKYVPLEVEALELEAQRDLIKIGEMMNQVKLTPSEAKSLVNDFRKKAEKLLSKLRVDLETTVEDELRGTANKLLEEYKQKLIVLMDSLGSSDIKIQPLEMMADAISVDSERLISNFTATERVKVDEEWVSTSKWYKPWTWGDGYYRDIYKNKDYVDGVALLAALDTPVENVIAENCYAASDYAVRQAENVSKQFQHTCERLDGVLNAKLIELEGCANSQKAVEADISDYSRRLDWLTKVTTNVDKLLEI